MKINILCFGITKDITGAFELKEEIPTGSDCAFLLNRLKTKFPELTLLTSLKIARNTDYIPLSDHLNDGDEIILMPPVSGG